MWHRPARRVEPGTRTTACNESAGFRTQGARFNNVGSQITVVVLQNTTNSAVEATLWFWGADGSPLGNHPLTLPPLGSVAVNTFALPGLAGQGGSLTISSDAPYGGLSGKSVALEPTTGLAFDTFLEPRPR